MVLDFSKCRLPPFQHQREDVEWLMDRPYAFIASSMRTGKTKIVIDAAQFMFRLGVINHVLVVAPAPVRDVWYDPTLGEIRKHLWEDISAIVQEFHVRQRIWEQEGDKGSPRLHWMITNFEFIRSAQRVLQLLPFCGPKTLIVGDESSFLKNYSAQQTRAFLQLRRACGRVVLLNGTPVYHSPLDLFSQGNILHATVLDCKYITHFKAKYAVQEVVLGLGGRPLQDPRGKSIHKIVGWTNLDDLQRRFAPVTVRRLQQDCLDLPPKLDPVTLTATLTPDTWRAYKNMRDELVVWLKSGDVSVSATAAARVMRLAQITSGFLGGLEDPGIEERTDLFDSGPEEGAGVSRHAVDAAERTSLRSTVEEIGREKLDILLWFLDQRLEADDKLKIVVWCRFRAELLRMVNIVHSQYPQFVCGVLMGGQKKHERIEALALLKPETSPDAPVFVAGTFGTGSFGLDMTAAHTSVTMSSDYSPGKHAQAADRVYGPGQVAPIAYFDIVASGPAGQRTIDHTIVEARRAGENIATWTAAAWVKKLI